MQTGTQYFSVANMNISFNVQELCRMNICSIVLLNSFKHLQAQSLVCNTYPSTSLWEVN